MQDSRKKNQNNVIFDLPPDYGDVGPEDFALHDDSDDDYDRHFIEERMEQSPNSTKTEGLNSLPPAIQRRGDTSISSPITEESHLEPCLLEERDRRRDFVFEVEPDEVRCLLRIAYELSYCNQRG